MPIIIPVPVQMGAISGPVHPLVVIAILILLATCVFVALVLGISAGRAAIRERDPIEAVFAIVGFALAAALLLGIAVLLGA